MSWGRSCASEGYPGIYSNVHKHKEWIESVTMCGDVECSNDGYCEFDKSDSKVKLIEFYRGGLGMNGTFCTMGSRHEWNIYQDGVQI